MAEGLLVHPAAADVPVPLRRRTTHLAPNTTLPTLLGVDKSGKRNRLKETMRYVCWLVKKRLKTGYERKPEHPGSIADLVADI